MMKDTARFERPWHTYLPAEYLRLKNSWLEARLLDHAHTRRRTECCSKDPLVLLQPAMPTW